MTISETDSSIDAHLVRHRFMDAMSVMPLYDYLDKAYQEAGLELPWSPFYNWWWPREDQVPLEVRSHLSAEVIRARALERISTAVEALVKSRSDLDHDVSHLVVHQIIQPTFIAPHVHVVMKRSETPGFASEWRYEFNPYQLARASLSDLESFIQITRESDRPPFELLMRICSHMKRLGPNTGLVMDELQIREARNSRT